MAAMHASPRNAISRNVFLLSDIIERLGSLSSGGVVRGEAGEYGNGTYSPGSASGVGLELIRQSLCRF